MQNKFISCFLFCILFKMSVVQGEIQEIVMKWNALLCLNECESTLANQLNNIANLRGLRIDSRAGTAVMGWQPYNFFSYAPFNLATRTVGIRIADFRLKVSGKIRHSEDNFYMVSEGDNTTYLLVGPIRAVPDRYIIQQNIASRPLSADIRIKLLRLADSQETVIIEGPLFEPLRAWLILIVEQLKLPKKDAPQSTTTSEIEKYKLP